MTKECGTVPASLGEPDHCSDQLVGGVTAVTPHASQHAGEPESDLGERKKTVKIKSPEQPSTLVTTVYAKELSIARRSILRNDTPHNPISNTRAKTLFNQPLPTEESLKPWKYSDQYTKLAIAATPLFKMAEARGWEMKAFTLVLSKRLSERIDSGDTTALTYIRDQLTRLIPEAVHANAEFLYAIEKAPTALADNFSRRHWHLHGLMIGPTGFSAQGKTRLRKALQPLKGEADSDLMFRRPGRAIDQSTRLSAVRWCFYATKNGLSVQLNPGLTEAYELPQGKETFISSHLRREAKRWHEGRRAGMTLPELLQLAPKDSCYRLAESMASSTCKIAPRSGVLM